MKPFEMQEQPSLAAPWQAQAFAIVVHLNAQNLFSWSEWGEAFSLQRKRSADAGVADRPDQYYYDWIAALEQLLIAKGRASEDILGDLKQRWEQAYLRTPHGQPVHIDPSS